MISSHQCIIFWSLRISLPAAYDYRKSEHYSYACVTSENQALRYVQTDATTPNILGPTLLGVVEFVCTQIKAV